VRSLPVLLGLLSALVLIVPSAQAVTPQLAPQDQQFLEKSHQNNLAEVFAGNLAQSKGECPQVRHLGAELVAHHLELDMDVITVAMRHGVPLSQAPSAEQLAELNEVATKSGREFDLAWLRLQIATHLKAIELGELETRYGQDPDVRHLAAKAAPILQHHLTEAQAALQSCMR
jgi:putative membrane protein